MAVYLNDRTSGNVDVIARQEDTVYLMRFPAVPVIVCVICILRMQASGNSKKNDKFIPDNPPLGGIIRLETSRNV
jgi:hypothetical protein